MKITEKDELYKRLPERERKSALKYIRFIIRGKLNRNVPVLLNEGNYRSNFKISGIGRSKL